MAKSAYETSIDYGKETAAAVAETYISNGLGDRLFDIPSFKIAQSTLAALLTNAYTSGMMEALRRLSPPVEDPHPTAATLFGGGQ
jgi:hypothetical protein